MGIPFLDPRPGLETPPALEEMKRQRGEAGQGLGTAPVGTEFHSQEKTAKPKGPK